MGTGESLESFGHSVLHFGAEIRDDGIPLLTCECLTFSSAMSKLRVGTITKGCPAKVFKNKPCTCTTGHRGRQEHQPFPAGHSPTETTG